MNFKLFSMAFITTGVVLTSVSIAAANNPLMLESAQIPPGQMPPGQMLVGQMPPGQMQKLPEIPGLNLTDEQKSQLKEIQEEARSQITEILTSEQQDNLKRAIQEGKKPPVAMQSLNLSDEQKQKMRELMESQREKINAILTDEQQEKLREFKEKMPKGNMPFGNFN